MDRLEKMISIYADDIFIFAVFEAFLIVALIVYAFYLRRNHKDERIDEMSISDNMYENEKVVKYWKDAYYEENKQLNALKRKMGISNQNVNSNHVDYKQNAYVEKKQERSPFDDLNDYLEKEKKKGYYVRQTTNDDGTVKSEIDFGLTNNEPAEVSIHLKYDYLEAANAGQFRKLLSSDEKCFFRTWEENGIR